MSNDRIKRNHTRLNKILGIDKYISDIIVHNETDYVIETCNMINELDITVDKKILLSLENICYSVDKNRKAISKDKCVENIIEYFLYNNIVDRNELEYIFEKSSILRKPNLSKVKEFIKKYPIEDIKNKTQVKVFINKVYSLSEKNMLDETPNILAWIRKGLVFSILGVNLYVGALVIFIDKFIETTVQRTDVTKMITKLNKEKIKIEGKIDKSSDNTKDKYKEYLTEINKNIYKLEGYEEKLYSEREMNEKKGYNDDMDEYKLENVSCEIKDYLDKYHALVSIEFSNALNECTRLTTSIYNRLYKDKVILPYNESDITRFKSVTLDTITEYTNVENKIEFTLADILPYNNKTTNLLDSMSKLCKSIKNSCDSDIDIYYEYSEDMGRIVASFEVPITGIYEELASKELKKNMSMILALESTLRDIDVININEDNLFSNINENNILSVTDAILDTNVINKERALTECTRLKNDIYSKISSIDKYVITNSITESVYRISSRNPKLSMFNKNRYEVLSEQIELHYNLSILKEVSLGNKIKLTQKNLTKNIQKLSDKDKVISRRMDNALDSFYNKVEKDLTNKNREKVIKGSILPSASSIVKIGLLSSTGVLISPILTVVGILGGIAMSKQATQKERQYILDEIEIMNKLVDKKIQLAEQNNDMKALESLLRTQQQMQRERQRIKYKLRRTNYPVSR